MKAEAPIAAAERPLQRVHPAEVEGSLGRLLVMTRLIRRMRCLAHQAKTRRAERLGWGLCSTVSTYGGKGFARPRWLAVLLLAVVGAVGGYGVRAQYALFARDIGGARCAPCDVRPGSYFGGVFASTACLLWLLSLLASHWATKKSHDWGFFSRADCGENRILRVKSWQCCLWYEVGQLAVTLVAVANWLVGVHRLAMIDIPGDPMHLVYVPFGRQNYSLRSAYADDNPLGLRRVNELQVFLGLEFFVTVSVALAAVSTCAWRVACDRDPYAPKLWVLLDVVEIGTLLSSGYWRVLDERGLSGTTLHGYSPFVLLGVFRFVRLLRFERHLYLLYSYDGVRWNNAVLVNGVKMRYYLLLLKLVVWVAAVAAGVCAVEYPCEPNAVRFEHHHQLDKCNGWFKRYDMCVYFLFVTIATIGYGDMYPATLVGRNVMVLMLLFVLSILPALSAHLTELSDGDDMSQDDYSLTCIVAIWEEMATINARLDDALAKTKTAAIEAHVLAEGYAGLVDCRDAADALVHKLDDDGDRLLGALEARLDRLESTLGVGTPRPKGGGDDHVAASSSPS